MSASFSIKITGMNKILKDTARLLKTEEKVKQLIARLGELGYEFAVYRFDPSIAIYDGTNDVEVIQPYWKDDNTLVLEARGRSILFIEFGSGTRPKYGDATHPLADELGMIRGEYGKKKAKNGYWFYTGEPGTNGHYAHNRTNSIVTSGNPANRVMFDTGLEMRDNITRLVREVFDI